MESFRTLDAVALPLDLADLDTDRIFPSRFMRKPRGPAYADYCFHDLRAGQDSNGPGSEGAALDDPRYSGAGILVAGPNFGQGSSREGAVYALQEFGFRAIVAAGFGEIFAANAAANGLLTISLPAGDVDALLAALRSADQPRLKIDLAAQSLTGLGFDLNFEVAPGIRERLLAGIDDITMTLGYSQELESFAKRYGRQFPWLAPLKHETQ